MREIRPKKKRDDLGEAIISIVRERSTKHQWEQLLKEAEDKIKTGY